MADINRTSSYHSGGVLTIDRCALRANYNLLAKKSYPSKTAAVVKADAYGLGIETVVPALYAEGCRHFFVAHISEALVVRKHAADADVYVLNGLLPDTIEVYFNHQLSPVLGSHEELSDWQQATKSKGQIPGAALHFDTGMNRLGFDFQDASALAALIYSNKIGFPVSLVMSHFVESEIKHSAVTQKQVERFAEIRPLFDKIPASLCNSSGIFQCADSHYDLVRSGYALYGGHPLWSTTDNPMQPVIRLEAPIVQTRWIKTGESVGYGGFWHAKKPSRLAILSIGYADGYPRGAQGTDEMAGGRVLIGGSLCPIIGRISMDLVIVDASDAPEHAVKRGAMAVIIGNELGIDAVGDNASTIGYDILVSLGRRYARRIID